MKTKSLSAAILLSVLFISCGFKAQPSKLGLAGENFTALNKDSVTAKVVSPKHNNLLFFKFNANQIAHLKNVRYKNFGASIQIKMSYDSKTKPRKKHDNFTFGFLYENDFENETKLKQILSSRKTVYGTFEEAISDSFNLSLAISTDEEIPVGFYTMGDRPYYVSEVHFSEPKVGWKKAAPVPFYGCGADGGAVDWNSTSIDFTNERKTFGTTILPKITVEFLPVESAGTSERQTKSKVTYSSEDVTIRRSTKSSRCTLQTSAFSKPYGPVFFAQPEEIISVIMTSNSDAYSDSPHTIFPLVTDVGLVINWPQKNWRCPEYELYEWEQFPGILFFDFDSFRTQNQFFTRLAYFAEKAGYKGTLVPDDFVENRHGYNAHDYRPEDLAAFFTKVDEENFQINSNEKRLKQILIANKVILKSKKGGYKPGTGAVISICRESKDYIRWTLMAHESWHGIYFTDADFRYFVESQFNRFDTPSMDFLQTYWETQPTLAYDRSDDYLMKNEFMAYIMQQPVSQIQKYYLERCDWNSVQKNMKELADYMKSTGAESFLSTAEAMNRYAFDNWGLSCGRVGLVFK